MTGFSEQPVNGWGEDPMNGRRMGVDDPHAMTTALRYTHIEELDELLPKGGGRFGRDVQKIACPDPEMAPSRTSEVERMRDLMKKSGYDVDPRLVAAAILERLAAGGVSPATDRKRV
jgi:hypothetical protein